MSEPVCYYNSVSDRMEEESIYGDRALRWTYGNPLGRLALRLLIRKRWASSLYGKLMARHASREKIAPFIDEFHIDESDLTERAADFSCFDAFFTRALKRGARPVCPEPDSLIFPSDGRHLAVPDLEKKPDIFVKNQRFPLDVFLGGSEFAKSFRDGSMLISRLCPVDYHRTHFPCAGTSAPARWIDGSYYSVNPLALRQRPSIFAENQRCVTQVRTERFGTICFIEIAATFVGSIVHTHPAHHPARKGEERGWFRFGGSSVAVVFEKGSVQFDPKLLEMSEQGVETYAPMGRQAGRAAT